MKISEILKAKQNKPVFSFEFFPPKTPQGEESLYRTIDDLKALNPDFVSITYGAGGSTREKTVEWVKRIKFEHGVETMAHLTCVGASVNELEIQIELLRTEGIENILALRGDPPKGQTKFTTFSGGFSHAVELIKFIRQKWGDSFSIGAAGYPEKHPEAKDLETDIMFLKEKIFAGADFVTTQLFFDNKDYYNLVQKLEELCSGNLPCPIIPGIMPITAPEQIEKFADMCGAKVPDELKKNILSAISKEETEEIGVKYAINQAKELLAKGAPGIHFYTLNKSKATRKILSELMHK